MPLTDETSPLTCLSVLSKVEKFLDLVFLDFGADNADLACDVGGACSYIELTRNVVEVDPLIVLARDDALGSEDHTVCNIVVELAEDLLDLSLGIRTACLITDTVENLVRMVMMVAAAALFTVFVVMVVLMLVMVVLMVVVLMLMIVVMLMFVVIMVVMVLMVLVLVVIIVIIVMMSAGADAVLVVVMVMLVLMLFCLEEGGCHIGGCQRALDSLKDLCARQKLPGRRDDLRMVIDLADQVDNNIELLLLDSTGTGQDDRACVLDLVLVEFLEVLEVDLALGGVDDRYGSGNFRALNALYCGYYVRELADAGGLDQYAVGIICVDHLAECGAEVAHEGTADTAGVHLRDLDACLLEEAAVDADLTEFVLDKDYLLLVVAVGEKLLDKGCLTCSEES